MSLNAAARSANSSVPRMLTRAPSSPPATRRTPVSRFWIGWLNARASNIEASVTASTTANTDKPSVRRKSVTGCSASSWSIWATTAQVDLPRVIGAYELSTVWPR